MNKVIIVMLAIIVVFVGVFSAIALFGKSDEVEVKKVETEVAEEILDDCTDEYELIKQENTLKTNASEEKTSPNCALIIKIYYKNCGHTSEEYNNLPEKAVNLNREQIEELYKEYKVQSFTSNEVVLYQEKEGECGEHFILKDDEGILMIYKVLEDGTEKEYEKTAISTEYLPETDKINMIKGIRINGKKQLNQLLEDFE